MGMPVAATYAVAASGLVSRALSVTSAVGASLSSLRSVSGMRRLWRFGVRMQGISAPTDGDVSVIKDRDLELSMCRCCFHLTRRRTEEKHFGPR
jgi:hypothetical protein